MSKITLELPFPPSVNRLWRMGNGRMYRSPKYEAWRRQAIKDIDDQSGGMAIVGKYKITLLAVKPDKRRRDLGNLEKAVSDILVTCKLVEDDHMCQSINARWEIEGPPFTVILEPADG